MLKLTLQCIHLLQIAGRLSNFHIFQRGREGEKLQALLSLHTLLTNPAQPPDSPRLLTAHSLPFIPGDFRAHPTALSPTPSLPQSSQLFSLSQSTHCLPSSATSPHSIATVSCQATITSSQSLCLQPRPLPSTLHSYHESSCSKRLQ